MVLFAVKGKANQEAFLAVCDFPFSGMWGSVLRNALLSISASVILTIKNNNTFNKNILYMPLKLLTVRYLYFYNWYCDKSPSIS